MSSNSEYTPPKFTNFKDEKEFFTGKEVYGLTNFTNTCFMNSIIQCLGQTLEFTKYILSLNFKPDLKSKSEISNELEAIQRDLVIKWYILQRGMWNTKEALGPKSFHQTIQVLSIKSGRYEFVGNHQKDAPEFLEFLLENMHMALSDKVVFEITGEPEHIYDEMALEAAKSWEAFFHKEYSKVIELFYGQYHSEIICPECGYTSTTYQPFMTLQVPLPHDKPVSSLSECLSLFNNLETLDLENQWKCEDCDDYRKATKKMSIWMAPEILTIHLKRFNRKRHKIENMVTYPLENLSLNDYSIGYGKSDELYSLYAVVNHSGDTSGGHYYAYVKTFDNKWYCANDLLSTEIDVSKVVNRNAYMLFYRRNK